MIYTFGYLGQSFAALQAWLVAHDGVPVDIRYSPKSRVPGWHSSTLRLALSSRYEPCWQLGNRNYKGGPIEIANMDMGIEMVSFRAMYRNVVLLCKCRDLQACHRHVVAEELRRRGHVVEELVLGEVGACPK